MKCKDRRYQQLEKTAFVYNAERTCNWCPQGQPLNYQNTTQESRVSVPAAESLGYLADTTVCAACPFREPLPS